MRPGKIHLVPLCNDKALDYASVLRLWHEDDEFTNIFANVLAATPYATFIWETPAISAGTASRRFECVIMDAPHLAVAADPEPFAGKFNAAIATVTFANRCRNAFLVSPCPDGAGDFSSLGPFLRSAPPAQIRALWREVGRAMGELIDTRTVWLSTAGAGVAWLHIRLDSQPKYYRHAPFAEAAP